MMNQTNNFYKHPKAFALFIGFGSIMMFFTALFSALITKRGDLQYWVPVILPKVFYFSTIVLLISSVTLHAAENAMNKSNYFYFRLFTIFTIILALLFIFLQFQGYSYLTAQNHLFNGAPSASFVYVISGFHIVHFLFGIMSLLIYFFYTNYRNTSKPYSNQGLHLYMISKFWDFMGFLWLIILLFFKFFIYNI
jgi:cytochrome c oxidase subunit 3